MRTSRIAALGGVALFAAAVDTTPRVACDVVVAALAARVARVAGAPPAPVDVGAAERAGQAIPVHVSEFVAIGVTHSGCA